ncbi:MAG: prolyl oligopeptidase family serine peptidase [Comamonadaceae bacterium]|uniref:alpha/beta hydrolase family protein n=1 Tax=Candidatus Skiveiella danica TaxID=3386177 RepID=UPI00390931A5|nr:prolyl oligopeptidase family serine peptidase [Comamonadaceae bacterium]
MTPLRTLSLWPATLLAAMVLTLSACGGGDSPSTPVPIVPGVANAGQLKDATPINTVTLADLTAAVGAAGSKLPGAVPRYAVTSWRLTYMTSDGFGREVLASGLVSVPVKPDGARSPVLSYQHATIYKDAQAPSNQVAATEPPVVLASLGFIVVAADYVGYGASRGSQHPYLLSTPTAAVVMDLLTAARTWRQTQGVADNRQLFMLGYSEGGYTTLAAHRAMQASASPHLTQLVASVPGAGPYHVGVTLDAQLQRVRDESTALAALVSPGRLSKLGTTVRDEVRRLILRLVIPDDADVTFQSTFLDNFLADDAAAIDRDSNVHDWKPATPIRLFHGRDDQTVPYAASTRTLQAMQARGAGNTVTLTDCTATPASHLGCVAPYFSHALGQLAPLVRDL